MAFWHITQDFNSTNPYNHSIRGKYLPDENKYTSLVKIQKVSEQIAYPKSFLQHTIHIIVDQLSNKLSHKY